MKIIITVPRMKEIRSYASCSWPFWFAEGLKKHNVPHEIRLDGDSIESDLAIGWSQIEEDGTPKRAFTKAQNHIVLERGYLGDRLNWASVAYNGLNNRGDFNIKPNTPNDRYKKYWSGLKKPWNPKGKYVLVIGQISTDASLAHLNHAVIIQNISNWFEYQNIFYKFRKHPGPVIYAEHFKKKDTLLKEIKDAVCVVTINSTAGVISLLEGKPTIALDEGSMAYPIAYHDLKDWNRSEEINRDQWLNNLSYCQWTEKEFKNGTVWENIKR